MTSVQNASGSRRSSSSTTSCGERRRSTCGSTRRCRQSPISPTQELDAFDTLREKYADDPRLQDRRGQADGRRRDRIAHGGDARAVQQSRRRAAASRASRQTALDRLVAELDKPRLAGDDSRDRRSRGSHGARRVRARCRGQNPLPARGAGIASSTSRRSIPPTSRVSAGSA